MSIREMLQNKEREIQLLLQRAQEFDSQKYQGSLEISMIKGKPRYYHNLRDESGKKHKHYLSAAKDAETIRGLAQTGYNQSFIRTAKAQLQAIRNALRKLDDDSLKNVYALLHNERKKLIDPFVADDEEYVREWENDLYPQGFFDKSVPEIFSERGERVRSKSEKIIADRYKLLTIPYKYEKPLVLMYRSQYVTVRPDFTVLNRRTRVQRYHEHFGKMDDVEYVIKCINKIRLYEMNGIFLGEQLIVTFESQRQPLNMKHFNALIDKYFI